MDGWSVLCLHENEPWQCSVYWTNQWKPAKTAICDKDGDNGTVRVFFGIAEVRQEEPWETTGLRSSRQKGRIKDDDFWMLKRWNYSLFWRWLTETFLCLHTLTPPAPLRFFLRRFAFLWDQTLLPKQRFATQLWHGDAWYRSAKVSLFPRRRDTVRF